MSYLNIDFYKKKFSASVNHPQNRSSWGPYLVRGLSCEAVTQWINAKCLRVPAKKTVVKDFIFGKLLWRQYTLIWSSLFSDNNAMYFNLQFFHCVQSFSWNFIWLYQNGERLNSHECWLLLRMGLTENFKQTLEMSFFEFSDMQKEYRISRVTIAHASWTRGSFLFPVSTETVV